MLELNITQFFTEATPMDYSSSIAEIGDNAGADTWRAAMEDSDTWHFLDTEEKREEFRKFVLESGGWDQDEIDAWSDTELNGLCIQWIAGDIREGGLATDNPDWESYRQAAEEGRVNGRLFTTEDGAIYWCA